MSLHSHSPATSIVARLIGIISAPGPTMRQVVTCSFVNVLTTWAALLVIWAVAAAWLVSTPVGRQALVDERVRAVEALGGVVDDATYDGWRNAPPYWIYGASGGRALLAPLVTGAVALGLYGWLRPPAGLTGCLSVAVHASTALVVQQLAATPLHAVRESLTSPFNLAALLPFFDEGSPAARFFGTIELFGVWWVVLLAVGCAALSGRRARTLVAPLLGVYGGVAAAIAAAVALAGGS